MDTDVSRRRGLSWLLARKGVACFLATSLEKIIGGVTALISFSLLMDAAVSCRTEVCYPFWRKRGR